MKILKSRIFLVILTAVICISGSVYATIKLSSNEIEYKDTTVEAALNDLYTKANKQATQVATLTTQGATYTMQNDGYIIGSASQSSSKMALLYLDDKQYALSNWETKDTSTYYVSIYASKGTVVTTREYGNYNLTVYEWK